jgi:hypothetical protein
MGKFLRFAIMFGPMIYKGVKKFMANRKGQNPTPPEHPESDQQG